MIPLAKNIKRSFSLRKFVVAFSVVVACVLFIMGAVLYANKTVVIVDDGKQVIVQTSKHTVEEVLQYQGIKLDPSDSVSLSPDTWIGITDINQVHIRRATPIYLAMAGKELRLMTHKNTVADVLLENGIQLSSNDRLEGCKLGDKIKNGMKFKVIKVREETVNKNDAIPFKLVAKPNDHMSKGEEKVITPGKEGVSEKTYKVLMEDGKEIKRKLLSERIISDPVNRLVEYGTVLTLKTARGDLIRYSKVLNMAATAYTSSYADTGKHPGQAGFGITYTGTVARRGCIAVDPRVIPLGSRVYVECPGSIPDYGIAKAEDIGGAIKGNKVDLYFDSQRAVQNWGVKRVKVYVLK